MDDEVRLVRESVDLVDRRLQGRRDIGIRGLIEAHVGVTDLDEMEFSLRLFHLLSKRF
jgi:hypothetical protein